MAAANPQKKEQLGRKKSGLRLLHSQMNSQGGRERSYLELMPKKVKK